MLPLFLLSGTGKTKTIVETIGQIVATTTRDNILVCTNSNAICDEITLRLIQLVPEKLIYRLYSPGIQVKNVPLDIRKVSNVRQKSLPNFTEIISKRILICTMSMAGRLIQANINEHQPKHFSYLFIDDCTNAKEPTSLIPLIACSDMGNVTAKVILCGDPKQMTPIVHSHMAQELGLGISLNATKRLTVIFIVIFFPQESR